MGSRNNYIKTGTLTRAEVLVALYNNAGSAGLGLPAMALGRQGVQHFSVSDAQAVLDKNVTHGGSYIDYLHGRRMKLFFSDAHPNRIDVREYNQTALVPAKKVINALLEVIDAHLESAAAEVA